MWLGQAVRMNSHKLSKHTVKPTFLTTTRTKTWRHGGRGHACARWPARTMQLPKGKADRERPSEMKNDDTSISWGLGSVDLPPPHSATFQGRYCMSNAWRTGGHQSTRQARPRHKRLLGQAYSVLESRTPCQASPGGTGQRSGYVGAEGGVLRRKRRHDESRRGKLAGGYFPRTPRRKECNRTLCRSCGVRTKQPPSHIFRGTCGVILPLHNPTS